MPDATNSHRSADVIVIGGGVIGCAIALRLAQANLKVLVLDRAEPGGEASAAAAGMLAPQGELTEPEAFSDLCMASKELYARFVEEVNESSGQEVYYRQDGSLLVALDDAGADELEEIYRRQRQRGFRLELLEAAEVHRRVPGLAAELRSGLFVPGDHWIDNERLMGALVKACQRNSVRFEAGCQATGFRVKKGLVESVEVVFESTGDGASYSADAFILAAGCWSHELVSSLGMYLPLQPCRGQMLEFEVPEEFPLVVRSGLHYLVPRPERRIVVGTTAEYVGYKKWVTGEGLRSILEGASRLAPLLSQLRFRRAWAGLRPDTADHLPVLGYGELQNLIFATGHFRNGILLAPVTAQLISELVLKGATSRPLDAYRPTRFASRTGVSLES
jgi:glycine oxidase